MKENLGSWLFEAGQASESLKIFEELGAWAMILKCHVSMKQLLKAEKMLRAKLKDLSDDDPEAPYLWTMLGEVTNDDSCYRRAWRISGERYARAMRCLGEFYYKQDKLADAIEYFKKSLTINPLFPNIWFEMGYAFLRIGKWKKALTSFSRVVQLEPESTLAWANMGSIHLVLKQAKQAFTAFKQALKENQEDPKLWQNFLTSCLASGEMAEAVYGQGRLLDIVGIAGLDKAVIEAVVQSACIEEEPKKSHLSSLLGLVDRIHEMGVDDCDIYSWRARTVLLLGDPTTSFEMRKKEIELVRKEKETRVIAAAKGLHNAAMQMPELPKEEIISILRSLNDVDVTDIIGQWNKTTLLLHTLP